MIDWVQLAWNILWIAGLSLALAVLGYARWEAIVYKQKLTARLNQPATLAAFHTAAMLFCLGLGGTATPAWQKIAWFALAVVFLVLGMGALIPKKARP